MTSNFEKANYSKIRSLDAPGKQGPADSTTKMIGLVTLVGEKLPTQIAKAESPVALGQSGNHSVHCVSRFMVRYQLKLLCSVTERKLGCAELGSARLKTNSSRSGSPQLGPPPAPPRLGSARLGSA